MRDLSGPGGICRRGFLHHLGVAVLGAPALLTLHGAESDPPAASAGGVPGATAPAGRILFLHLRMKDGALTLIDAQLRPGALKKGGLGHGDLRFELLDADGAVLATGTAPDPSRERVEGPGDEGQLVTREIERSDVEFMVRVAYKQAGRRVQFLRPARGVDAGGVARTGTESLGILELPALAEGAR